MAGDAPRHAQHRLEPDPRPLPRAVRPWAFATARGIFSTPVLGGDETVYVGSADRQLLRARPDGTLRWRFRTGGIIDAAAALGRLRQARGLPDHDRLGRRDASTGCSADRRLSRTQRIVLAVPHPAAAGDRPARQLVGGQRRLRPRRRRYVGNTGGGAYSLTRTARSAGSTRARQLGLDRRRRSAPTATATGARSTSTPSRSTAHGQPRWQTFTPGYVTSSPALGSDGTVYVGSFDGRLYALDPQTGAASAGRSRPAPTSTASPALAEDPREHERDLHRLRRRLGLRAAPDRAPALALRHRRPGALLAGARPRADGDGRILYVGSSNGKLYALDAATGRRRWSFDTTPSDPALRDRNDLNGSPALGKRGVYIGGEHGRVWFVPYDYCLHNRDPRCDTQARARSSARTSIGSSPSPRAAPRVRPPQGLGPPADRDRDATHRPPRRDDGGRRDAAGRARVRAGERQAARSTSPHSYPATATTCSSARHGPARPKTRYRVSHPRRLARRGAPPTLRHADVGHDFGRARPSGRQVPLHVAEAHPAFSSSAGWRCPLPPLLPSVNQIGFDSYDMIAGTISRTKARRRRDGRVLLWVIGARRDRHGVLQPIPPATSSSRSRAPTGTTRLPWTRRASACSSASARSHSASSTSADRSLRIWPCSPGPASTRR